MVEKNFPVRKRIRLPLSSYQKGNAFFITISTYMRYPWFKVHRELADFGVQLLCQMGTVPGTRLYAWCIMPDHIHLLLEANEIVEFVRLFKGRMVPKALALERNRRLWQRSFYDHGIRKEESLQAIALYIWENPVRAGIVDCPQRYTWSGSQVWPNWRESR